MKDIIKASLRGLPWYMYAILAVAVGLIIGGFFTPPMGEISGSVLQAVGLLIGGTAVFFLLVNLPEYIKAGMSAKIKYGETSLTIGADLSNDNDNNEAKIEE